MYQVEAEVEVARVRRIEVEPGLGLGGQGLVGPALGHRHLGHRGLQTQQRLVQQSRVDRLLALEVRIDGAWRVAGFLGDFTDARALDARLGEHRSGGVEHQGAAGVGEGLAALELGVHGRDYSPRSGHRSFFRTLI
ncbi:hypothetical protein D9M69_665430 [compost metagenome]